MAEYRAACGLSRAIELGARQVLLRSDSKLLIEQLAGRWKVKNPTLIRLHGEIRALIKRLDRIRLEHVPRERNERRTAWRTAGSTNGWPGPGSATGRPSRPRRCSTRRR